MKVKERAWVRQKEKKKERERELSGSKRSCLKHHEVRIMCVLFHWSTVRQWRPVCVRGQEWGTSVENEAAAYAPTDSVRLPGRPLGRRKEANDKKAVHHGQSEMTLWSLIFTFRTCCYWKWLTAHSENIIYSVLQLLCLCLWSVTDMGIGHGQGTVLVILAHRLMMIWKASVCGFHVMFKCFVCVFLQPCSYSDVCTAKVASDDLPVCVCVNSLQSCPPELSCHSLPSLISCVRWEPGTSWPASTSVWRRKSIKLCLQRPSAKPWAVWACPTPNVCMFGCNLLIICSCVSHGHQPKHALALCCGDIPGKTMEPWKLKDPDYTWFWMV